MRLPFRLALLTASLTAGLAACGQQQAAPPLGASPSALTAQGLNGTDIVAGATYRLVNEKSTLALDVAGGSKASGANVQVWTVNNASAQNWKVEDTGNGYATLKSQVSGLCLDAQGGGWTKGANVQQYNCNNTSSQHWKIVSTGNGYYKLVLEGSGNVLDVAGGGTTAGTNVQVWSDNGLYPQHFKFERVDGGTTPTPPTTPTPTPQPGTGPQFQGVSGTWKLAFGDEFEGTALDKTKWVTCWYWYDATKDGCINEANGQISYAKPRNVTVSGGALHLRTVKEEVAGYDKTYGWSSGMISSGRIGRETPDNPSKFAAQYGYLEMRVKMAPGKGVYNAFWTLPDDQEHTDASGNVVAHWPPELDVFERLGNAPTHSYHTVHWIPRDGQPRGNLSQDYFGPDPSDGGWHTYGLLWDTGKLVWFVDGREVTRFTDASKIPNEKMYLVLASEIWGNANAWSTGPDSTTPNTTSMDVDYVRVWKREGGDTVPLPAVPRVKPVATFGTPGIGSSTADKAFDGDTGTAFDAADGTNCHAGVDAGAAVVVDELRYFPRGNADVKRSVGGQLQASSSQNGPWTTLYTIPDRAYPGKFMTASFPNTAAYRYYRYVGPADAHCNVAELELPLAWTGAAK